MKKSEYIAVDELRSVVLARDLLLRLAGGLADPMLVRKSLDAVKELQADCGKRVTVEV